MKDRNSAVGRGGIAQSRLGSLGIKGLVIATTLLVAGCDSALSPEDYLARATSAYQAGDTRSALIDLKALLSEHGDNTAGRLLLARLYADRGDFELAAQELDKALDRGAARAEVLPLQAYLWRRTGEEEALLALDVSAEAPDVAAAVLVQQASMLMAGGWLDDAGERLDEAAELDSSTAHLPVERARLSAVRGDSASALAALQQITATGGSADAWVLLGTLEKRAGNTEAAVAAYSEAIKLRPHNYMDVVERGFLNLQLGRLEAAEQDFSRVAERYPQHFLANYGRGMIQQLNGQPELALESVQSALGVNPDFTPALLLQGALQLDQGMLTQATRSLSRFNALLPGTFEGQALLGIAYGRSGDLESAEPLLQAALALKPGDVAVLVQLAQLVTRKGDVEGARELLQRAIETKPQDYQLRLLLGANYLLADQAEMAEEQFDLAAEIPGGEISGHMALARYYMDRGDAQRAMQIGQEVLDQHPQSQQAMTALGRLQRETGQLAEAKALYEAALAADAGYPAANFELASMAMEQGDLEAAEKRYADVLAVNPENLQAKLMLAELESARGNPAAREELLRSAVAEHPDVAAARLALAQYQIEAGEVNQALASLEQMATVSGPAGAVQYTRAQALLANGDFAAARRAFASLLEVQPENPQYLYFAGRSSEALADVEQARAYYQQAAALDEDFLSPRVSLHALLLNSGDLDGARALREQALELGADDSYTLRMEVDELAAAGDLGAAISQAGQLLEKYPSTRHQLLASMLQWKGGERQQAVSSLESWLEAEPDDQASRSLLAEFYLAEGEDARSRELYEMVLAAGSANARALNNLANLLLQSDPARALELASQAVQEAPESAEILDTLAWAEHANGQRQLAVRTSNRALQMAPDAPELKWSNIQFQLALDNKAEAMAALADLLETYDDFPGRADAEKTYQER